MRRRLAGLLLHDVGVELLTAVILPVAYWRRAAAELRLAWLARAGGAELVAELEDWRRSSPA